METNAFNPKDWIVGETKSQAHFNQYKTNSTECPSNDLEANINEVTTLIEQSRTDITETYENWLTCAFALADGLGENGRSYFHRVCCFYSGYDFDECDRKFTMAVRDHGHGVSVNSFFYLAKQHGIELKKAQSNDKKITPRYIQHDSTPQQDNENTQSAEQNSNIQNILSQLPTFNDKIFDTLPEFLKSICSVSTTREERDLLLLGSLVTISSCLSNVSGIYGGVKVFPNLFLYITAQASAGKGRLNLTRRIVEPIHNKMREINKEEVRDYEKQMRDFKSLKNADERERPKEPPLRMLFIPANSSATAMFQILGSNEGIGLLFETEGDTLANTFKSEHGNYSDGLRKAFHHEKISYLRRKDKEYITLDSPKLSVVLSGTPKQIGALIPDVENGLFSRFIFYSLNMKLQWLNVFDNGDNNKSLDMVFDSFGSQFFEFYSYFHVAGEFNFTLNEIQKTKFNNYFSDTQYSYFDSCGEDYIGTVRRLGLVTFRIMMILSALRVMENGEFGLSLNCLDEDFDIALKMADTLAVHSSAIFNMLPEVQSKLSSKSQKKNILLNSLGDVFKREDYIEMAEKLGFSQRSADRLIKHYIDEKLVEKTSHYEYKKIKEIRH